MDFIGFSTLDVGRKLETDIGDAYASCEPLPSRRNGKRSRASLMKNAARWLESGLKLDKNVKKNCDMHFVRNGL